MSILTALVLPSGVALILLLLGLLAALRRQKRVSWALLAASGTVTLVFSSGMVAAALMSPLEYAYPTARPDRHPEARHIVVLTGWAAEDQDMPLTGRLNVSSAYRVLLALEIARARPDCDIVVSGARTTARVMARAIEELGIPRARILIEGDGDSTADSAALLRPIVGGTPFFLVTSAGHMPRSMAAMARHGLDPIAAPTEHQLPRRWERADWKPTPASLQVSDLAVHEYLARLWEAMRGPKPAAVRRASTQRS